MKIAITGAAGYFGRKIIERLEENNECELIVGISRRNFKHPFKKLQYHQMDVRDKKLKDLFQKYDVDIVVHLAFVLNPIHDREEMRDINVNGAKNVLNACKEIGIEKIYNHNMKLIQTAMEELSSIEHVNLVTPTNRDERGSIVTFGVDKEDPKRIFEKLRKLKRPVELTIRQNMIRISPHIYNTEEDISHFTDNLRKILS